MKTRPTIFLSGVSHEFGSFRDAVENEIEMKDCFAENQPGFSPSYHEVEQMLRRKLHDSDAVIHIVGFRFGAEPNLRQPGIPRRSYTQMEFDIAREMQKPVYVFISADAGVRDPLGCDEKTAAEIPDPPQDAEATALQEAHRKAVQSTNHLYYFFKDKAELRRLVAEIPIVATAEFRADISRIGRYAPDDLIGRETELKVLDDAWLKVRRAETKRPRVLTFVALGGEGKTSLVAKWAVELAGQDWPGCDAVFAWSFYSQGTREQVAADSDLFLKAALYFFGDADTANSPRHASEKGKRLAELVGQRRTLLILDGLEPLQYPPSSTAFAPGQLKDDGIAKLLKGLASASHGLCLVTTRYSVPDLKAFCQTTAPEVKLLRLSRENGVRLLKTLGVKGSELRNIPFTPNPGSEAPKRFPQDGESEAPKGASQASPGQRPGFADENNPALKGRNKAMLDDCPAPSGLNAGPDHTQGAALGWPVSGRWPADPESRSTGGAARGGSTGGPELVNEYEKLVEDVKGHALTLTLLGGFLKRAFHGDIRQRDRVKFEKADALMDGGHAFRVMASYEQWLLRDGGDEGRREVAVLRLMGLFDRPADAGCLAALRREPIPGLTEPLDGLADEDWEFCLSGLEAAKLLTVNRDPAGALVSLDAHPHIREYFARELRAPKGRDKPAQGNALGSATHDFASPERAAQAADGSPLQGSGIAGTAQPGALPQAGLSSPVGAEGRFQKPLLARLPILFQWAFRSLAMRIKGFWKSPEVDAWRAAHRRLYEHLCSTTKEGDQPTLEDLQPLYQAVAHGCQAGFQQRTWEEVFCARIARQHEIYSMHILGASGSDLGAIACFFESQWGRVSTSLSPGTQAWLLNEVAFRLIALGRMTEALEPVKTATCWAVNMYAWRHAVRGAVNLSELKLTLGAVAEAVEDAASAVTYANRGGDRFDCELTYSVHAAAFQHAGTDQSLA